MDGGGADALWERVERLEGRVARIESACGRASDLDATDGDGPQRPEDDRFWALQRLGELVEEPGGVLFAGTVSVPGGRHYEWQQAHPTTDILDSDWAESVGRLSALAHPVRMLLLHEVLNGSHTAGELSTHEQLGTTGQLYHHLRQLVAAGWLRASGHGRYEVPPERVVPLLVTLAAVRP